MLAIPLCYHNTEQLGMGEDSPLVPVMSYDVSLHHLASLFSKGKDNCLETVPIAANQPPLAQLFSMNLHNYVH